MTFKIFGLTTLVAVAVKLTWEISAATRRAKKMAKMAALLGYSFQKADQELWKGLPKQLLLFGFQGVQRPLSVSNVFRGTIGGRQTVLFDYSYALLGQGTAIHRQTVALVRAPNTSRPSFFLRPTSALDNALSLAGIKDINFGESAEFSKHYHLEGSDEAAIRTLFNVDVLRFFQQHHKWCVQADSDVIVMYRDDQRVPPTELRSFLQDIESMYWLWK